MAKTELDQVLDSARLAGIREGAAAERANVVSYLRFRAYMVESDTWADPDKQRSWITICRLLANNVEKGRHNEGTPW